MANEFQLSVVLKGVDQFSPVVKGATEKVDKLAASMAKLNKLKALAGGMNKVGNGMLAAGVGLAAGLGIHDVIRDAAKAEHSLAALANIANLSPDKVANISRVLTATTRETNQSVLDLITGLTTLMGKGWDENKALSTIGPIGMAATAAGASVEDLSRTVFAGVDNLKVPISQTTKLLNILSQAGKEGSFELKDMAKEFPALTAQANLMKISGVSGASQIAAGLQIAMKGAGDASEAANNMKNFLTKITAPTTKTKFAKVGINLEAEFNKGVAGGDVMGHMVKLIQKITGGNQFKVGALFEDMQVKAFLAPMMENMAEYERIQKKALGADGVLEKDYGRMMGTFQEQWKRLKLLVASTVMPKLAPYLESIGKFLEKVNQNPGGMDKLLKLMVGLIAGGVLLKAASGILTLGASFAAIQPAIAAFTAQSLIALWPVAALAAAGYLVYKHWNVVGPVIEGIGTNLGIVAGGIGDVLSLMGKTDELDKFNDKLKQTESIATLLAKAMGVIAYGLTTITAVQKGLVAGTTAYTPGNGLYTGVADDMRAGGANGSVAGALWGGISGAWKRTTGLAGSTFLDTMQRGHDPLNIYGTSARVAASQGGGSITVGGATIHVNGAQDPKTVAEEIDRKMRENAADYAEMMRRGAVGANRGAF